MIKNYINRLIKIMLHVKGRYLVYNPRIGLVAGMLIIIYSMQSNIPAPGESQAYVCHPCGAGCDKSVYTKPGICTHCQMPLVKKESVVFKNISPVKVCDIASATPEVLLLDVRTPEEFGGTAADNFGRLKNAVNIPVQELEKRLGELNKWKNKGIIVYCSHSHRSPFASYILTQNGFTHVSNMLGGMSVWEGSVKDKACGKRLLVK